eukprot:Rmarinus@m.16030
MTSRARRLGAFVTSGRSAIGQTLSVGSTTPLPMRERVVLLRVSTLLGWRKDASLPTFYRQTRPLMNVCGVRRVSLACLRPRTHAIPIRGKGTHPLFLCQKSRSRSP